MAIQVQPQKDKSDKPDKEAKSEKSEKKSSDRDRAPSGASKQYELAMTSVCWKQRAR